MNLIIYTKDDCAERVKIECDTVEWLVINDALRQLIKQNDNPHSKIAEVMTETEPVFKELESHKRESSERAVGGFVGGIPKADFAKMVVYVKTVLDSIYEEVKNDEKFRFTLRKEEKKDNIECMVYREEEKQDDEDENALIFLRKQMKDLKKYLQEHGMA